MKAEHETARINKISANLPVIYLRVKPQRSPHQHRHPLLPHNVMAPRNREKPFPAALFSFLSAIAKHVSANDKTSC